MSVVKPDFSKSQLPIDIDEAGLKVLTTERITSRINSFMEQNSTEGPEIIVEFILPNSGKFTEPKDFLSSANTFVDALILKSIDQEVTNDQKMKLLSLGVSLYKLGESQKLNEDEMEQLQEKILSLGMMTLEENRNDEATILQRNFDPSIATFFKETPIGPKLSRIHKISVNQGNSTTLVSPLDTASTSSSGTEFSDFEMIDSQKIPQQSYFETKKKSSSFMDKLKANVNQFVVANLGTDSAKEMQQMLSHLQKHNAEEKEMFDQISIGALHQYLNDDLNLTKDQFFKDYARSGYSITDGSTKIVKLLNDNSTSAEEGLSKIEKEVLKTEDDLRWEGALLNLINQSTANGSLMGIKTQITGYLAQAGGESSLILDQLFYQPTIKRDKNGKIKRIDLVLKVTFHKVQQENNSIEFFSVLNGNATFSVKRTETRFQVENLDVELKVNPFPLTAAETFSQSLKKISTNLDKLIQRTDYQSEEIKHEIRILKSQINYLEMYKIQLTKPQSESLDKANQIINKFIVSNHIQLG